MKVLIVEDEKRLAESIRKGLVGEGHVVELAHDGEQGLWAAREGNHDVIVLDIMLPRLNGYQVCDRLRAEGIWTPILMLTAKDGEYDVAEALDTGADDYLTKPFSFVVLTARLRALARRGAVERPTVCTVDDLVLDPATHRCTRGDATVALTPKEFGVLELLMRRAGQVVSKSEILSHAWDQEYDGDTNIVEVFISSIRRKVDAPFGRTNLKTVRGAGYLVESDSR